MRNKQSNRDSFTIYRNETRWTFAIGAGTVLGFVLSIGYAFGF